MKQSRFQWLRARLFPLALLSALMLPFQNCSQAKFGAKSESQSTLARGGNGTGYGGKVYSSNLRFDRCNDNTTLFARFTTTGANSAVMDRQNCLDIGGLVINLAAPSASHHYSVLPKNPYDLYVYDEKVFLTSTPVAPLAPVDIIYVCEGNHVDGNGISGSVKIVQGELLDANGDPTIFVATLTIGGSAPREILLDPLNRTTTASTKNFNGSNASGTYTLDIDLAQTPDAGVLSFNGPSLNMNATLTCTPNY